MRKFLHFWGNFPVSCVYVPLPAGLAESLCGWLKNVSSYTSLLCALWECFLKTKQCFSRLSPIFLVKAYSKSKALISASQNFTKTNTNSSFWFICVQKSAAVWQQVKIFPFLVPWQVLMRVLFIPRRQWAGNSVRKSGCCCDNSFPDEASPLSRFATEMLTSRPAGISCLLLYKLLNVQEIVHMQIRRVISSRLAPRWSPGIFGFFPLPPALPVPLSWNPLDRSISQSLKWEIVAFLISFSSISAVP